MLRLITHVQDGTGTVRKTIEVDSADDWKMLQQVFQRATNLWPDAPPAIKELADLVTVGKVLQNYKEQDTSAESLVRKLRQQKDKQNNSWICLLCKSGTPGYHTTLDDGVTPCPNKGK